MKKPNGYKAESYGGGRQLPAGGYVCIIKGVKEDQTPNGTDVIRVQIDIAEGEYRGFYAEKYASDKERSDSPKWRGIVNIWPYDATGTKASRSLNAFGGALDDIGVDLWDASDNLNISGIRGKRIGVVFRREEFRYSDGSGKTGWTTKPIYTKPASDIEAGNFSVPDDKPLDAGTVEIAFTATSDDIPF